MGRKKIFTESEKLKARDLYSLNSYSIKQVAKSLDCSQPTIKKLLVEQGVEIRKRGRVKKDKTPSALSASVEKDTEDISSLPVLSKEDLSLKRERVLEKARERGFISNV